MVETALHKASPVRGCRGALDIVSYLLTHIKTPSYRGGLSSLCPVVP
jgi:hypothetical protein